jgi:hypothetical protein
MISTAPLPNTTPLNASTQSAARYTSQSSGPSAPAPFSSVFSTAQGNHPEAKNSATVKSQDSNSGAVARSKNSDSANSTSKQTQQRSASNLQTVPTSTPASANTPTPTTPAAASSTPAVPLPDAPTANVLVVAELSSLAAAQTAAAQGPVSTSSSATQPSATAPNNATIPVSVAAPAVGSGNSKNYSTELAAALLPRASVDASAAATNTTTGVQPAPKDSNAAVAQAADQLAGLALRLRATATLPATTPPTSAAAGNQTNAAAPATPTPQAAALKQAIPTDLLAGKSGDTFGTAIPNVQKAPVDNHNPIVQEISAKLQAALTIPEAKALPAPAANNSGGGNAAGNDSNQTPANSDNSSSGAPPNNSTQILAASASTNSGSAIGKIESTESAIAAKAAGPTAATVEQMLRAPADATAQSAWADAGPSAPQTSKENIPAALPQVPTPPPLPASLSEVAQASQLYQRVGGAEMHLAMQTDLLGSIELHTVVHQSTLSATIGVQRADVQSLLANDLPALQHALAEQRFHVEQLSVLDSSVGGRLDQGGHQQQSQNGSPPSAIPFQTGQESTRIRAEERKSSLSEVSALGEYAGQLSIRV